MVFAQVMVVAHPICNLTSFVDYNLGSCTCDSGWSGISCSIECKGGSKTPCSLNGTCDSLTGLCKCNEGTAGEDWE